MVGSLLEVFSSIQGEGRQIGQRHLFLRFAGCNLRCRFCDTPLDDAPPASFPVYLPDGERTLLRNPVEPRELVEAVRPFDPRTHAMVSFTGGEPLMQAEFLRELAGMLMEEGHARLYLDTNGSLPDELEKAAGLFDVIAMDMKLPSAYGGEPLWKRHERFLRVRPEHTDVKTVITRDTPLEEFMTAVGIIERSIHSAATCLIIQPVWPLETPARMLLRFQEAALERLPGVRVIAQQQQLIGVR
jgi:7-carboxy-7-deazaguanine synthase